MRRRGGGVWCAAGVVLLCAQVAVLLTAGDACPAGQLNSTAGVNGTYACLNCAANTYSAAAGQASCLACVAGSFSAAGATVCTSCSDSAHRVSTGSDVTPEGCPKTSFFTGGALAAVVMGGVFLSFCCVGTIRIICLTLHNSKVAVVVGDSPVILGGPKSSVLSPSQTMALIAGMSSSSLSSEEPSGLLPSSGSGTGGAKTLEL